MKSTILQMENKIKVINNFIVLEGLDGAGTTTQGKRIFDYYKSKHKEVSLSCEPTNLPTGKFIRSVLSGKNSVEPKTMADLFVLDRREHLFNKNNGILYNKPADKIVISDRYLFSSLAYQSLDCGWDYPFKRNSVFPLPSHLIYIEINSQTGEKRMSNRGNEREIYENVAFQQKVEDSYKKVIDFYSMQKEMQILKINGNLPMDEISEIIFNFIP